MGRVTRHRRALECGVATASTLIKRAKITAETPRGGSQTRGFTGWLRVGYKVARSGSLPHRDSACLKSVCVRHSATQPTALRGTSRSSWRSHTAVSVSICVPAENDEDPAGGNATIETATPREDPTS